MVRSGTITYRTVQTLKKIGLRSYRTIKKKKKFTNVNKILCIQISPDYSRTYIRTHKKLSIFVNRM